MNPFDIFLTNPILNLLIAIYKLLESLSLPGALGLSIIALTAIIRLALWPMTTAQLKSTQKMAALKPHLERIKNEHGHDKLKLQQETTRLYKEHGVNPLAGCLPLLLQLPIFIALYNVLIKIVDFGKEDFLANINSKLYTASLHLDNIPDTSFIGFNLADKPSAWREIGFIILLVPIITGLLQFLQSKMMAPPVVKSEKQSLSSDKAIVKADGKPSMEDSMAQVQSQMILIMPVMIAFFSYGFPLGLSLYWNTFTIIGIAQQYMIAGAGALNKYLPDRWRK